MPQLTPAGESAIQAIAQRHGFSVDAVLSMLDAVIRGNGSLAQFSHPEFGGSGQWMAGGMTMVGDMFNGHLKGRVANLCEELAQLIAGQPDMVRTGSFQSQSQNGHEQSNGSWGGSSAFGAAPDGNQLFAPPPPDWWGPDLKWPNATGAQNGMRYAWFSQARRLAIEAGGKVTIYDTLDHRIGGVSQQQSSGDALAFTSQYGFVDMSQLPVISVDGLAPAPSQAASPIPAPGYHNPAPSTPHNAASAAEGDIFSHIEKLAELQRRGIITDQEFTTKKTELLSRI